MRREVGPGGDASANSPLFQIERRDAILERVMQDGRVDVAQLARTFNVTNETIRRDLTDLQDARLVKRVHGGAVPWTGLMFEPLLEVRRGQNTDQKRRIARAAALEIPEGGSILIDSGSTLAHLADQMNRDADVTIFTNSIPIVRSLASTEGPDVVVVGGTLRRNTMALVDETGVEMLRDINVDVLFIACDGVSPDRGFTTPYRSEVAIKRAMMNSARRVVMLFDHSKIGHDHLYRFASIGEVDKIFTGHEVDDLTVSLLEQQGPTVTRV